MILEGTGKKQFPIKVHNNEIIIRRLNQSKKLNSQTEFAWPIDSKKEKEMKKTKMFHMK